MALDERYITGFDLNQYFVNKDTGAPLAGGIVNFYQDDDLLIGKNVFILAGSPPDYDEPTYAPIGSTVVLSSVGTMQFDNNNVAIYAYPFDADGNNQLYTVVVTDANGVPQFTRNAWPNSAIGGANPTNSPSSVSNVLSNSQFVEVDFDTSVGLTITTTGAGVFTTQIAPDWYIRTTCSAITTVTVTRQSIQGTSDYPSNAPYTLTVTPGASITELVLFQRLMNNPNIYALSDFEGGGYVSGSIMLGNNTTATMYYKASEEDSIPILTRTNNTGAPAQYNETVYIGLPNNDDDSDVGYVEIGISLTTNAASVVSNVQIVGLNSNEQNVQYEQLPVNRQKDYLFHYYNPSLQYKPISSYLTAWDFPLNPAQFLGPTVAASAIGANRSKYVWDQTIIFQSTDTGVGVTRATSGALVTTAAAATKMGVIQYQPQAVARQILNGPASVNVSAKTSVVAGVDAVVSLWYTTDANLPNCNAGTNLSIVATLDDDGTILTRNGTWTQVPRTNGLGKAKIKIMPSDTENFNDYGLSGWDVEGIVGASTATFFAIVVSTAQVPITGSISWNSISLVPGYIATRPAPQSFTEVVDDCQYYYRKSFEIGTVPAVNIAPGLIGGTQQVGATTPNGNGPSVVFQLPMRATPVVTLYNPFDASNSISGNGVWNASVATNVSSKSFRTQGTPPAGQIGLECSVQYTADARLGIVN